MLDRRHISVALVSGWVALGLAACDRAPSSAQNQPVTPVHGEPISPASNSVMLAAVKPGAAVVAPATESKFAPMDGDYPPVGFDKLASYNFEVDDAPLTNQPAAADKANDQIPANVKAFNEKKVAIKGFMLPLKVADGAVTEFLIMKDQSMCCYGTVPKITEWVSVKTTGAGVKAIMDQPVSMMGTLHVGAMRENGYLVGIYQMDGDKLIAPEN